EVGEPVVAHVLRAVAAEAVVDVGARPGLEAHEVPQVVRRAVERIALLRREHAEGQAQKKQQRELPHRVTRSGTGFTASRAVYQGMRKKNRKYTTAHSRPTQVARSLVSRKKASKPNCPHTVVGSVPR